MKIPVLLFSLVLVSCCPCKELRGSFAGAHPVYRQYFKEYRKAHVKEYRREGLADSVLCEKLRAVEFQNMRKLTFDRISRDEREGSPFLHFRPKY